MANDSLCSAGHEGTEEPLQWSKELGSAQLVAPMLTHGQLDLRSLMAGIFIVAYERIARYWSAPSRLEDMVRTECHLSKPRWMYWFDFMERIRTIKFGNSRPATAEYGTVFQKAEQIARRRERHVSTGAVVTVEDVLFAIATDSSVSRSRALVESGIDMKRLEEAIRSENPGELLSGDIEIAAS